MITYTKQNSSSKKKNICIEEKVIIWINFYPGLALAGFQTTLPGFNKLTGHEPAIQPKTIIWSAVNPPPG